MNAARRQGLAKIVLDASAVLAVLNDEPGADVVAASLRDSVISAVNVSETVAKLADGGMPDAAIREALRDLLLDVVPFDSELAYDAGLLRPSTRDAGLSLGDRACLALARRLGLRALTDDESWKRVAVGVEVSLIR